MFCIPNVEKNSTIKELREAITKVRTAEGDHDHEPFDTCRLRFDSKTMEMD